jgi:hypothetical protein
MKKYFAQYDADGKLIYSELVDDATIPKYDDPAEFLYLKALCFHLGAEILTRETGKTVTAEISETAPADKVAPVLEPEPPIEIPEVEK